MERSRRKKIKKAEARKNIFSAVREPIFKIVSLLIIIGLNWTGLSAIGYSLAYFNDAENSNADTYQTGILDFYLSSSTANFIPLDIVSNMKPGDSVTREISVIKATSSNPFQYNASTTQIGGQDDFCNALELEAKLEGETKYSDGLMNFTLNPAIVIGNDGKDDWSFIVTMPLGTVFSPGDVCQIKFVFYGWQTEFTDSALGFFDQEEINSSFAAGGIKINKVYYDVDTKHGSEYANEWIELYNPLDNPVDISDWVIKDNNATDTIPVSDSIPAHGFAIITGSSTTWGYWDIPNDVVKIVLPDGRIGNGLNNDSDRVILIRIDGVEDDAMSYGADTYAFEPPCPDVSQGHILARVPTGFDTNLASDWKNLGLPSVTVNWPNGGEVLWVGRTYTLEWSATNPNGDNNLLSIDLWYSGDSGATWANIVKVTENDGVYDWRVPLYINGYYVPSHNARIKAVATGPENFMVQNWDMSDTDFCPPIDYSLLTPEELELLGNINMATNSSVDLSVDFSVDSTIDSPDSTVDSDEDSIVDSDEDSTDSTVGEVATTSLEIATSSPELVTTSADAATSSPETATSSSETTIETIIEQPPADEQTPAEQPVSPMPSSNDGVEEQIQQDIPLIIEENSPVIEQSSSNGEPEPPSPPPNPDDNQN